VREALDLPGCVTEVFATASVAEEHPALRRGAERDAVPWHLVDEAALASLAETVRPQGVVAVCRFVDRPLADLVHDDARLLAICADVRDPGNAGTVIRCADAAGADAVVLTGSSVDPYNGKAVRASVGSLFHVPLAIEADAAATVARLAERGFQVLAADGEGETDLDDAADSGLLARRTARRSATRPTDCPTTSARSPLTASGSRSTAVPRASTWRPPRRSASTPPHGPSAVQARPDPGVSSGRTSPAYALA
jgi:TrmH family RNA methyltransferase